MILVIGGLNGFIGSNTTEALVSLGEDCVVTRHKNTEIPGFLQKYIDHHRVFVEPANATSEADLRKIGAKHDIDGVVKVAGGFSSGEGPLRGLRGYFDMLDATFLVALRPGRFPFPPLPLLETKRLQADTGFSPRFDTRSAIQHYVDWLKAGNPK